jgi:GT2 family glycosyltransferase
MAALIVVDNGDGIDCGTALAPFGGNVVLHATGGNLGFSGGCNAGIRDALSAGVSAVLLVNSDVIVPPDCVGLLMDALARQPRPGIIAPIIRSRAWPGQVLSAGIDFDTRTGRLRHRLTAGGEDEVASVSGCVMLVHTSVFDRIGLLPEEYFFSFEDVAFCQRARREGFDVGLEPRAIVYHEGSGTMGTSPARLYYAARNHLRLGHACTARGGALPSRLVAVTRGIADHLRGRYGEG